MRQRAYESSRHAYESIYAQMVAASQDAIIVLNYDGIVTVWNEMAERLFGFRADEAIGRMLTELFVPKRYCRAHLAGFNHFRNTGQGPLVGHTTKMVALRKDGAEFPIELTLSSIRFADKWNVIGIIRDTTAGQERDPAVLGRAAVLTAINRVFEQALVCESEEALGKTCLAVAEEVTASKFGLLGDLDEQGRFHVIAIDAPGWESGKRADDGAPDAVADMPIRGVARATIRDGISRIVNGRDAIAQHPDRAEVPQARPTVDTFLGVPLKDADKTIGIIGLGNKEGRYTVDDQENIEALAAAVVQALKYKRAEIQIKQLNERLDVRTLELEAADEELEAFSQSVSRDLNAPLIFAQILSDDHAGQLDADGRHLLGIMQGSALRMAQFIDELLTFARIGRKWLRIVDIDMAGLVHEVLEQLQLSAPGGAARVEVKALPDGRGDPALIHEVFVQLLSNAAKFSLAREHPVIEVGGKTERDENMYYVKDNGIGFDKASAGNLFETFQRAHGGREFDGSGIGLALVQRVVRRHGGRVWAEGKPNKGAKFWFTLPVEARAAAYASPGRDPAGREGSRSS